MIPTRHRLLYGTLGVVYVHECTRISAINPS
jgi:hypothetical protein